MSVSAEKVLSYPQDFRRICLLKKTMILPGLNRHHNPWAVEILPDSSDNEELMSFTKPMMDASNPNDDIWRKFALPLTPPSSPSQSYGESSDTEDGTSTEDIADRLHDVCESLDSAFDVTSYNVSRLANTLNLRSKLISDCMWSGNTGEVVSRSVQNVTRICNKKLCQDSEEDLYPTPCASPLPVVSEGTDCPSSSECVDPTTVFPFSLQSEVHNTSLSDTDEEIDVVTVDLKSAPFVGIKRKQIVMHSNIPTQPVFKKAKSSPAAITNSDRQTVTGIRRPSSVAEDSDPETRRATHNVLERKRRIDLKNSFERLRDCVPVLEKQEKAPKVVVLRRAAHHIAKLTQEESDLTEQKRLLRKEKQDLVNKVNDLLHDRQDIVF